MKIARAQLPTGIVWVMIEDDHVYQIANRFVPEKGDRAGSLKETRLLAPVEDNNKVIALMNNFYGRANREGAGLFVKPNNTIVGPNDEILWPEGVERINMEVELAVVIGVEATKVKEQEALDYVLGYTVSNDVTSFSVLDQDTPAALSLRFKMYDTFLPLGPWIETELDPGRLFLRSRLNGELKQDSSTADMNFSVAETVAWVSKTVTLNPGDIISMGTPPGFADMHHGDIVECEVEGIGVLRNSVSPP